MEADRAERRIHYGVLLVLPWLLFLLNRNWPFQGFGNFDPFYYFGSFIHYPHYQRMMANYAGERLPWILPGYALVHIFGPVYGTMALHFAAWYTSVFLLYSMVNQFAGAGAAIIAASLLGCHPYFIAANGMDYVTGGCLAYCLLAFWCLARSAPSASPARWAFAAGLAWAAFVYSYLLWTIFTPACLAIYLAGGGQPRWRGIVRLSGAFALGGATITLALAMVHHLLFGDFAFQRVSITSALGIAGQTSNPFASENFSVSYADWLVFPGIAALVAVLLLIPRIRAAFGSSRAAVWLSVAYLYCFAVLAAYTPRGGILTFDFMATVLVPGAFLVLGVSLYRAPEASSKWFAATLAIACAISIAPLAKPGLYVKPPILGAVVPAMFLAIAVALRALRPRSALVWSIAMIAVGASAFCLRPEEGGLAWRSHEDWMSATRRVGEAVQIIEHRIPYDRYPAFWYSEHDPNNLEFQAIMCSFLSHGVSMRDFPNIDGSRHYVPGQVLILLNQDGGYESAALPLAMLWRERMKSHGVAYWIVATAVK